MDFLTSLTVNHVDAVLKEPHLKFVINKMNLVIVKKTYKAKHVINVSMERITCKKIIRKVAQNVFALERQRAVNAHIYVYLTSVC